MIIFVLVFFIVLVLFAISGRFFVSFKLGVGLSVVTEAVERARAKRYASIEEVTLAFRTVSFTLFGQDARGNVGF
jgi:hypothetical protein